MISFENLSPEDLLILINTLAISLSKDKSINELNVLGDILVSVGSLLFVFADQEELLMSLKEKNSKPQNNNEN